MALTPGTRLGPYEILGPLGTGGMGEVYRARHERLGRDVAIKVLPGALASDRARLARFEREARTASSLNHPNIITIHDIAGHEGITFMAMELVEGRSLRDLLADGALAIDHLLRIAVQIADGLARAHGAGIVHRDIKPANVMVTPDGRVKILDFGLAKPLAGTDPRGATLSTLTTTGDQVIAGTPPYMAPEQWSGGRVDQCSDQFSFGVLLYELIAGRRPFDGPSVAAIMTAVLTRPAPPLRRARPDVPRDLARAVHRCLEKDPAKRFESSDAVAAALRGCAERRARSARALGARLRRPVVAAPLAVLVLGSLTGAGVWVAGAERRWAEGVALGEITALIEAGEVYEAYRTGLRAKRLRPGDAELEKVLDRITLPVRVSTRPEGAEVWVNGYRTPDAAWERMGVTPVTARIPYTGMRWRISRAGYEPFEGAPFSDGAFGALAGGLVLDPLGARPPGTVRVPGGTVSALGRAGPLREGPLRLGPYYLDRYEVTNREFRAFVDANGYRNPRWWPAMERAGRGVAWEEAARAFQDATGRPGPAGWELGSYPTGTGDHPVGGISWYEAAAFCAFADKSLPTVYHWFHAIGQEQISDILAESNIAGEGLAPVGQFKGLAAYGTYDMSGNVREWAWNGAGELRYLLGGAWNEPGYLFREPLARDPWDRDPWNGVRCARYIEPPPASLLAPVSPERTLTLPEPLDDRAFALLRGLFAYDHSSLDARLERVNDTLPHYRRETASVRTAYGRERMEIHLLIPRDVAPPYQSVIWFPGSDVFLLRSSEQLSTAFLVDFLPRAGRVLVQPVYDGTYERRAPDGSPPPLTAQQFIRLAQDIGRTIDYLETRSDFDPGKIAYYGLSAGAKFGPIFTAVEPRFRASILLGAGVFMAQTAPETHPVSFAPRSRTPTLMISGQDDFMVPYETAQRPLFELLGVPPEQKRHARLPGGHIPSNRLDIVREVLDWLDRQLGPVRRVTEPAVASGRDRRP